MGNQNSNQSSLLQKQLSDRFDILKTTKQNTILYLLEKTTKKQFIYRQQAYTDRTQAQKKYDHLQHTKTILSKSQYLVHIEQFRMTQQDQFCATYHKISVLFQNPHKNFDQEISQRNLQQRKFEEKEIWQYFVGCILGLSYLQKNQVSHQCLKSSQLFINLAKNIIKLNDPSLIEGLNNRQLLQQKSLNSHIYLAPQLCEAINNQSNRNTILNVMNYYKSDVFTLGMIMLQAIFLKYQDFCYNQNYVLIYKQIQRQIRQIGKIYSSQLQQLVQLMLILQPNRRPDWIQLQNHINKINRNIQHRSPQFIKQTQQTTQLLQLSKQHQLNLGSNNIQSNNILEVLPNQKSVIGKQIKPKPGLVPSETYITHTRYDQNLIEIQQQNNQSIINKAHNIVDKQKQGIKVYSANNKTSDNKIQLTKSTNQQYNSKTNNINPIPIGLGNNSYHKQNNISVVPKNNPAQHVQGYLNNQNNYVNNNMEIKPTYAYKYQPNNIIGNNLSYTNNKPTQSIIIPPPITNIPTRFVNNFSTQLYKGNNIINQQVSGPIYNEYSSNQQKYRNNLNTKVNTQISSINNNVDKSLFTDFSKLGINNNSNNYSKSIYGSNFNKPQSNIMMFAKNLESSQNQPVNFFNDINNIGNVNSSTNNLAISQNINPIQSQNKLNYVNETYKHGSRYQGQMLNNKKHGKGKLYYQDGGLYDGQWKDNLMNGKGKLYYQSGKIAYDGEWKNDKFQGFGVLHNQNPKPITDQNIMTPNGGFNYRNFDMLDDHWLRFDGYFLDDMKQGKGKLILINGESFQGQFSQDNVNGYGTFVKKDGSKFSGYWSDNILKSQN